MATWGSDIQGGDGDGDGSHEQTLYLMNPNLVGYSDSNQQANTLLPQQHLLGIPLNTSDDPSPLQEASMVPRVQYNLWGSMDPQAGLAAQLGVRRPLQQGLSLTLSSHQHAYNNNNNRGHHHHQVVPDQASGDDHQHNMRVSRNSPLSVASNGLSSMQSLLLGSKYLKAAQELLDQVVNVGDKGMVKAASCTDRPNSNNKDSAGEGSTNKRASAELSTAQRQDLQMKKAKLVTMLDEVDERYRQYQQQMQIVASCFEQVAGLGAAKSYTALALQTISKQFRCLKDAICWQIKAASKSLGEDDCLGAKVEGSRLRQVDHHLRQQRALQHLGMIQHNAWRPQRGLPERAVSVLRAWLFEHFLHPYPKDSDKIMLAKQTGLTRSQVSNWFINARVRLWKPMVEEMYMEEVKEREQKGSEDKTGKMEANGSERSGEDDTRTEAAFGCSKPPNNAGQLPNPTVLSASPMGSFQGQLGMFNLIGMPSPDMMPKPRSSSDTQNSPSSILSMDMDMDMKRFGGSNPNHDGHAFGAYQVGDIGRSFNVSEQLMTPRFHGNAVSLTLGLPHCDNQQNYLESLQLGRKLEVGPPDFGGPSHSNNGYDSINDIQNRKRFAAQLLPDFVT